MKHFYRLTILIFLINFTLNVTNSFAFGVGLYGSLGSGSENWDVKNGSLTDDKDMDSIYRSYGVVIDSGTSGDDLFSYRISIGKQFVNSDVKGSDTEVKLDGIVIDQDFSFRIINASKLNLWVGPELRLSYLEGSPDSTPDLDMNLYGVGFGPVVGVNIDLASSLVFALKGGLLYTAYEGDGKYSTGGHKDEYEISGGQGFINCAIMLKFGEK